MLPRPVLPTALVAAAAAIAAVVGLAGCAPVHDSTGRVDVTVSADADAGTRYRVDVFDAAGQRVEHQGVFPGGSVSFAGVPLGRIRVGAKGLCSVRTTLTVDAVVHVTLGTTRCSD